MFPVPSIDLLVLNSACDDWENLASIRASVESALQGGPVADAALESSLLRLVQKGLLEAHEFVVGTFVPLSPSAVEAYAIAYLWFFITSKGRHLLDENESFFRTGKFAP